MNVAESLCTEVGKPAVACRFAASCKVERRKDHAKRKAFGPSCYFFGELKRRADANDADQDERDGMATA